MNIKILNVTHGNQPFFNGEGFLPIAAGGGRTDILSDDMGEDNISNKNPWYSEVTAIYWAWKNLKDLDAIGLSHYRRYISHRTFSQKKEYAISWDTFIKSKNHLPKNFKRDLKKYDIILPRKWFVGNIKEQFLICHPYPYIFDIIESSIKDIHPDCINAYNEFVQGAEGHFCCLFIANWNIFDNMCNWMFPLIFEIERRLDLPSRPELNHGYQGRMLGFIFERLLNVYYLSHHLKIKEYPIYKIENGQTKSIFEQEYNFFLNRPKVSKYLVNPLTSLFHFMKPSR